MIEEVLNQKGIKCFVLTNNECPTCNEWVKNSYDGLTKEFLDYMYSDEVQEGIVVSMGYISINDMKVEKSADGVVSVKE